MNPMNTNQRTAQEIQQDWDENPRWLGITRDYTPEEVLRLQGSFREEHTLARRGADRLWQLLNTEDYINALGALTGNQAVQQVKAGLKAIYLSGWQVAGDANLAGPADSPGEQARPRRPQGEIRAGARWHRPPRSVRCLRH